MAKNGANPFAIAQAALNGKFNGQLATPEGPKTLAPKRDVSVVDQKFVGSKDQKATTKLKA